MTKLPILSLALASAIGASATGPLAFESAPKSSFAADKVSQTNINRTSKVVSVKPLAKKAKTQVVNISGLNFKEIKASAFANNRKLQNLYAKSFVNRAASENASMFESFEDWDGDDAWLPEGWSIQSKDEENENPWGVGEALSLLSGCDGDNAAFIGYSDEHCDEWLISKPVTVKENEELSFMAFISPLYFYSMDNLDWDTYEYEGDKEVVQTLNVLISEDNGETWTTLVNFADVYADLGFMDLYSIDGWVSYSCSLTDYFGKTVQIAFQYEGTDGNTNGVDAVSIDVPSLDVSYSYPSCTQYFGLSTSFNYLPYTLALEPVFTPITWTNNTISSSASYSWAYQSPDDEDATFVGDDLTVTYHTDFTSDFTTRNNLYVAPTLTGSAPGAADGVFSRCDYFQVGGKAQFQLKDADGNPYIQQYGFSAFDYKTEGLTYLTVQSGATPLFGYSDTSDAYWKAYSFGSDDDDEGDYAYVDGIINIYQPAETPVVIRGGWVMAIGSDLDDDHEFTFEICPLNEDGEIMNAIATATCKGSDAIIAVEGAKRNYYSLPFTFSEPVVMSREVCDQYIARLTGIHECGEFFAPFQSVEDNPEGLYVSAIQKIVSWGNNPLPSLTMTFKLTGARNAFAMMLDAEYPWLQGEEEVTLEDNTATLEFNSYYDGSEFVIDAPEWLDVTVSGINDQCVATFTVVGEPDATEALVTLTVPGFEKIIAVNNAQKSGITTVKFDATNKTVKDYLNLSGVSLGATAPATPGIYMVRFTDGSARKITVK